MNNGQTKPGREFVCYKQQHKANVEQRPYKYSPSFHSFFTKALRLTDLRFWLLVLVHFRKEKKIISKKLKPQ